MKAYAFFIVANTILFVKCRDEEKISKGWCFVFIEIFDCDLERIKKLSYLALCGLKFP